MNPMLERLLRWLKSDLDFDNPELQEDNTILVAFEGEAYAIQVEQF